MSNAIIKVKNFIKDPDKKPYHQMLYEASRCMLAEKELPRHYFTRLLYKKGAGNYLDYMGVRKNNALALSKVVHNVAITPLLDNKLCFSRFMENKAGVMIPNTLGFNIKNSFYYYDQEKPQFLLSFEDIMAFFMELFYRSPNQSVFIKPFEGRQGTNCFLLNRENIRELEAEVFPLLEKGSFVFQEVVEQHRDIAQIYSHSLNTMRIDTYMDPQGNVSIITALMRFGLGGSVIDNITAGGFFVPIDVASGTFNKYGYQLLEHGGNVYTQHPDTEFVFEGFKIPHFEAVKEMITEAVKIIPDILLGWDIAVTDTGPVLIEGSQQYSPRMSEMAYGGYKNHPVYKEILKLV